MSGGRAATAAALQHLGQEPNGRGVAAAAASAECARVEHALRVPPRHQGEQQRQVEVRDGAAAGRYLGWNQKERKVTRVATPPGVRVRRGASLLLPRISHVLR